MLRQRRGSLLFSKGGRAALSLSLVPAVIRFYRTLLLQSCRNGGVIFRYAGARAAAGILPVLLINACPVKPLLMPFFFLLQRDDPDPFIPPQRTPVPGQVADLLALSAPLVPLSHSGVMRLQEALCRRELFRRLDIALERADAAALGCFGGVDRILGSLITAAGGRRALASKEELAHRLQIVLPLFLQILAMQGRADLKLPSRLFSRRRGRELEKKKREFLGFFQSLYPDAIKEARGRIVQENRIRRRQGTLHHLEVLREEYRFRLYISSLELLNRHHIEKNRLAETIERLSWNYDY
jgi:hypothetical protein